MSTNTQLDGIIGSTIDAQTDKTDSTETLTIGSHAIDIADEHTGITLTANSYTKELTPSTNENDTITATGFTTDDNTTLVTLDVPYDHKDIVNNLSLNCHASYTTERGWTVRFEKPNTPGTNGLRLAIQELTQADLNVHLTHKIITEFTN